MKKFILFLIAVFVYLYSPYSFSQNLDNITGDYLLASSNKLVSLDLKDADLVNVVKMLSIQTGLNFISSEAVKDRRLTLYLERTPLKEAIDIIFKANNLTYDYYPDANIFVIKEMGKPSVELKTKVYTLKYVRVKYSRLQKEISDRIEQQQGGTLKQTTTTGGATTTTTGEEEKEGGIKEAVKKVLTEFGKVTEDPITNSLIVTDVPSQFPVIDELISKLDVPLPLVMIETEMLDVSKRAIDKLGVNWPANLITLGVTGTKGITFPFPGSTTPMDDVFIKYEKGSLPGSMGSGLELTNWPLTNFTPTILSVIGADLILNYLKSLSDTRSLARPKIMTLANEAAEIKIVTNEAIGVTKTESQEGGTTEYTIEREETGTRLRVTPQVDSITGEITLFVEIIVKDATDSGFTIPEAQTKFVTGTIKNPQERSATAVARLKNGETLLLGGLIRTDISQQKTKLPLFGDLPLVGNFFRYKYSDKNERELLVFLTPKIVESKGVFGGKITDIREQASFREESIKLALDKYSKNY